jgi:hypothetical protein
MYIVLSLIILFTFWSPAIVLSGGLFCAVLLLSVSVYEAKKSHWRAPLALFFVTASFAANIFFVGHIAKTEINTEYKESIIVTYLNVKKSFSHDDVPYFFGYGPATYEHFWNAHMSQRSILGLNWNYYGHAPPYWYNEPRYSFGLLPTIMIDLGLSGSATILALLLLTFYLLGKSFFKSTDGQSVPIIVLLSLLFVILSVPAPYILALLAIGAGYVVAKLSPRPYIAVVPALPWLLSLAFSILSLALFCSSLRYLYYNINSSVMFERALVYWVEDKKAEFALATLDKLTTKRQRDEYYRAKAQIYSKYAENILLENESLTEEQKLSVTDLLNQSLADSLMSTKLNATNYRNWLITGDIYRLMYILRFDGANLNSKSSYNRSARLAGLNPWPHYGLFAIAILEGKSDEAIDRLYTILELKPDWEELVDTQKQLLDERNGE